MIEEGVRGQVGSDPGGVGEVGPANAALSLPILPQRRIARAARRRHDRLLGLCLLVSDALMLGLATGLAHWLRFNFPLPFFQAGASDNPALYLRVGAAVVLLWLLLFSLAGLYHKEQLLGGTREYALVFNNILIGLILITFASFLQPEFVISRAWLLLACGLAVLLAVSARFGLRRGVYVLRRKAYFLTPALIVGTNEEATALALQLGKASYSGLNVLGFVAAEPVIAAQTGSFPALGSLADLEELVERFDVEEMIVATSGIRRDDLVELFRRFSGRPELRLRLSGGLFEIVTTGLEVKQLAFVSLLEMVPVRLRGFDILLKGLLDYGLALAVTIALAPLFLFLWLLVRLDSPGPAIHRRRVLGLGGIEFDAFKFRSMHQDGQAILARHPELVAELAREHKLRDDPRITRMGHWLRRTSLDELPQVFNVLRGEMSIVGPRMIAPAEHEKYGQWDLNLLTVKPGITGLWQVSGRSDLSYDERVRLDMSYIRNWTIWFDLQILVQTIPAVLGRRGAY
jgi:exopolysaccharide biosynthesis polyprenyl glycosylphosphotransferase